MQPLIQFKHLFMASLVAAATFAQADPIFRAFTASERGIFHAKSTYIDFPSPTPVQRLAAQTNRQNAHKQFQQFVTSTKRSLNDFAALQIRKENGGIPLAPYEFDSQTVVSLNRNELVSLFITGHEYTGGAHPLPFCSTLNVGLIQGEPRLLTLTDVLQPEDLKGDLSRILIPKIMEKKHRYGENQEPELGSELMTHWFVSNAGMTWVFEAYSLGAYAEGRYIVKASWEELGPLVRSDGPLAPWGANSLKGSWEWVRFEGSDDTTLKIDHPEKYTLTFGNDDSVSGRVDVNRIRGTYTANGVSLTLGQMAVTLAMPPPGSHHDAFLKHLRQIRSYGIKDGLLHLNLYADGGTLVFRKAP